MNKRPRIALDIAVLGAHDRSGVFRFVDELHKRLQKRDDIELLLCTSMYNRRGCYQYLLSKELGIKTRTLKMMIKYYSYRLRGVETLPVQRVDFLEDLDKNIDAYFSPWGKIPWIVGRRKSIQKFSIIHDLVPVLLPKLCEKRMPAAYKDGLKSLKSDYNFVCISKNTQKDLLTVRKDIKKSNTRVIGLGADEKIFYPVNDPVVLNEVKKKYRIRGDKYFLSLSTLEPRKNFTQVIKSFIKFIEKYQYDDINLVLTGAKGWKFDKIFHEIKKYDKYKKQIIFTGFVDNEDLAALYSGATGFVYVSLYEGFGLPILEAMQCGAPVITSDNSSIPEVVGRAGIMVGANDTKAIVAAMDLLHHDDKLRKRMSQKGLDRAKLFSWDKTTDEIVNYIKEVVSES